MRKALDALGFGSSRARAQAAMGGEGRAWAAASARTLARRRRREFRHEIGTTRAYALAKQADLFRASLVAHWGLSDRLGAHMASILDAVAAARILGLGAAGAEEAGVGCNWARHAPPPGLRGPRATPPGTEARSLEASLGLLVPGPDVGASDAARACCECDMADMVFVLQDEDVVTRDARQVEPATDVAAADPAAGAAAAEPAAGVSAGMPVVDATVDSTVDATTVQPTADVTEVEPAAEVTEAETAVGATAVERAADGRIARAKLPIRAVIHSRGIGAAAAPKVDATPVKPGAAVTAVDDVNDHGGNRKERGDQRADGVLSAGVGLFFFGKRSRSSRRGRRSTLRVWWVLPP